MPALPALRPSRKTPFRRSVNVRGNALAAAWARVREDGMNDLERAIGDLVIANRILAKEDVVDAYGHVSIRHPQKPDHYLLSRSLSPEFVTRDDIIEFRLDGTPVSDTRPAYLERFIHGAIYEARPEINAVVHSHAEDILPFSISKTPLCCVAHVASDMGAHVPVWDIAEKFGDETNLLVINMEQGRDMARALGKNVVVLMRGHGFSAAAEGLLKLVRMAVYLPRNARILLAAMRMGEFKALSEGEIRTRNRFRPGAPEMQRGWEFWARRAGCGEMLADSKGGV
jgi:ribulose-5-phosphate 4-epimerase/fuculose-1-phosphate aldolase